MELIIHHCRTKPSALQRAISRIRLSLKTVNGTHHLPYPRHVYQWRIKKSETPTKIGLPIPLRLMQPAVNQLNAILKVNATRCAPAYRKSSHLQPAGQIVHCKFSYLRLTSKQLTATLYVLTTR
jgi:hypothetical protein